MTNILSERAMLAGLTVRQWTARRLDRKVTDEVNTAHGAANDAGRYNKLLISKNAIAEIQRIAGAARTEHYTRTLPWADEGARILPAAGYMAYADSMRKFRLQFESAVASFVTGYPDFVTDAKVRLNGLFNAADYPAPDDVATRFHFGVAINPCPAAGDFRVELAGEQADSIRAEIESRMERAAADAMRDIWSRIADHVGRMAERLRAFRPAAGKGDKSEGVFRDSLVENIRDLVALLPTLNIAGDAKLAAIADRMARELCTDDAAALRDNATARASVAQSAESILQEVGAYLS